MGFTFIIIIITFIIVVTITLIISKWIHRIISPQKCFYVFTAILIASPILLYCLPKNNFVPPIDPMEQQEIKKASEALYEAIDRQAGLDEIGEIPGVQQLFEKSLRYSHDKMYVKREGIGYALIEIVEKETSDNMVTISCYATKMRNEIGFMVLNYAYAEKAPIISIRDAVLILSPNYEGQNNPVQFVGFTDLSTLKTIEPNSIQENPGDRTTVERTVFGTIVSRSSVVNTRDVVSGVKVIYIQVPKGVKVIQ